MMYDAEWMVREDEDMRRECDRKLEFEGDEKSERTESKAEEQQVNV